MTRVADELRQPAQLWMRRRAGHARHVQGRLAEAAELIERAAGTGERVLVWEATAARRSSSSCFVASADSFTASTWRSGTPPTSFRRRSCTAPSWRRSTPARAGPTRRARCSTTPWAGLAGWHVDEEWLASVCLLAESCVLLGRSELAAPLYDLLLPYGSLNAVGVPELALGSTSRQLGILAALLGRAGDALDHFEEALRMNDLMGARPELARTQEITPASCVRAAEGETGPARSRCSRKPASYDELGIHAAARRLRLAGVAPGA